MIAYLTERARIIDETLDRLLPPATTSPATLHEAMRYSLFAGGKRLRPALCLAASEACGGSVEAALPMAAAVECLHTYTLIHDDLPCMDDDDFRRGRPTCHKVYGEGVAVLAGDGLLTLAFEILSAARPTARHGTADFVRELAVASGSRHLIGGQVMDLEGEGRPTTAEQLKFIHESKTAALLTASLRLGALAGNATAEQLEAVGRFGYALGLAFQVIDDILDVTQSSEKLGKSAGKDVAAQKATYPALFGLETSRAEAARLTREALDALQIFDGADARLGEIARYLLDRDY